MSNATPLISSRARLKPSTAFRTANTASTRRSPPKSPPERPLVLTLSAIAGNGAAIHTGRVIQSRNGGLTARPLTTAPSYYAAVEVAIVRIVAESATAVAPYRGGRPTMRRDVQAFVLSVGGLLAVAGSGLLALWAVLS
jgi:hypothetical protein